MLEKLNNFVFSNDDIDFDDIDSRTVTFFSQDMSLVTITIELKNFNLDDDDDNFDEDEPETIIHVRLMA